MTVEELIRTLRKYPKDMRVVVNGYETGFDDLEARLIHVREIRLNAAEEWWEGDHIDAKETRTGGSGIVNALVLPRPTNVG